jgi:RND family efflux transporter MFP subunit
VAVEVTPVRRTTIRDIGQFTGSLKPRAYFVIAPKVSGRLERLHVDIGDAVKRGQLIAELDDEEYAQRAEEARAGVTLARAGLEEARSSAAVARRELERIQALRKKKISSESELDATRARFEAEDAKSKVAQALIEQKEAALKAAEIRLSYTKIRTSWKAGADARYVGERFVDEGALLAAGSPVVSILEISSLTAVIHVTERDYSRVRVAQETDLTSDALPGRSFKGKIARVAPLLKESSREACVEIEISNPDLALKPGMFVRASIQFASRAEATVVPVAALAKRDERKGVFVVDEAESIARFVPVEVGIVERDLAEVLKPELSGLVVTVGQHLLEDGSKVRLPGASSGGGPAPGPKAPGRSARPH